MDRAHHAGARSVRHLPSFSSNKVVVERYDVSSGVSDSATFGRGATSPAGRRRPRERRCILLQSVARRRAEVADVGRDFVRRRRTRPRQVAPQENVDERSNCGCGPSVDRETLAVSR